MKKVFDFFSNITNKQAIVIIMMIACFHSLNSFIVLNNNRFYSYLSEDVASVVDMSTSFVHEYNIINNITNKKPLSEIIHLLSSYWKPPAFFLFSLPFLILIKNVNVFIAVLNFFISLITLISLYGIGKKMYSEKAGLLSAFLLSCCPLFFLMHRTFFIETLLTAAVALTLYMVITDKFDNIYHCVFSSAVISFGMLTKEQYFIYLPVFFMFIFSNRENYKNFKRFLNIFLVFAVSTATAYAVWYFQNAGNIFLHLYRYAAEVINSDSLFYIKSLYYFDITPVIAFLSAAAVLYHIYARKNYRLIISAVFVIFVFSLSGNMVSRHIFPVIIFFPLLISSFIFAIKNIHLKKILISGLTVFAAAQFILINYSDILYFRSNNFYGYNSFRGITYFDYKPAVETYASQYDRIKRLLGYGFEKNTVFINIFPPTVYNFLILQKNRNADLCQVKTYNDVENVKKNIDGYKNILVSSRDNKVFSSFEDYLLKNTNFARTADIDIFNHDKAKIYLYKRAE